MPALSFTALLHGLRHGIDWDHVAAIADLTSGQQGRRQGLAVASAYAAGHGLVVFLLGIVAVLAGDVIPAGLDETMSRTVGLTLVLLSISVVAGLVRHRRDHRLRSRWSFLLAGAARLRTRFARRWWKSDQGQGQGVRPPIIVNQVISVNLVA